MPLQASIFANSNKKATTERKISLLGMAGLKAGCIEILRLVQAGVDGYVNTLLSWCAETFNRVGAPGDPPLLGDRDRMIPQ